MATAAALAAALAADLEIVRKAFLDKFNTTVRPDANTVKRADAKLRECAVMFQKADADNSGDVSIEELDRYFKMCGSAKSPSALKALVALVDDDNTGTLRFSEFVNLIMIDAGFIAQPLEVLAALVIEQPKTSTSLFARAKKILGGDGGIRNNGALKKKKRGHLRVSTRVTKEKTGLYVLSVQVHEGRDLLACDPNGLSDPYVKMRIQPEAKGRDTKKKTAIVSKNLNPVFNETFQWTIDPSEYVPPATPFSDLRLVFTVMDHDYIGSNDHIGTFSFSMTEMLDTAVPTSGWFVLLDEKVGELHAFPSKEFAAPARPPAARGAPVGGVALAGIGSKPSLSAAPRSSAPKVTAEDFEYLKVLGQGSFGKVFLAREKRTGKHFAVKALKKLTVVQDEDTAATMTERRILALEGEPPFLARLYAAFQSPANLFFVMELITGGDLMMRAQAAGCMPEATVRFYTAEISCGLWFLHDRGILYRDLKLDNIMLDSAGHIKLADFGLCKEGILGDARTATFCGTPDYIAPEILDYKPYSQAVDWWSLGVVVYELFTNTAPFYGDDEDELYNHIKRGRPEIPRYLTRDSAELLNGFLAKNPETRLGAGVNGRQNIKAHKFFKTLDWVALEARQVRPPFIPVGGQDPLKAVANFDSEFTSKRPVVSPSDPKKVAALNQAEFTGFSLAPGNVELPLGPAGEPTRTFGFYK